MHSKESYVVQKINKIARVFLLMKQACSERKIIFMLSKKESMKLTDRTKDIFDLIICM